MIARKLKKYNSALMLLIIILKMSRFSLQLHRLYFFRSHTGGQIIVCCSILRDISTLKIKEFNCNFSNNRKRLKMHSCTCMKVVKLLLLYCGCESTWQHYATKHIYCCAASQVFLTFAVFSGHVLIAFCINYAALELQELRL